MIFYFPFGLCNSDVSACVSFSLDHQSHTECMVSPMMPFSGGGETKVKTKNPDTANLKNRIARSPDSSVTKGGEL